MADNKTIENLFEQTKNLEVIGERLSGEPEILHIIEDHFRHVNFYPIIRDQIRRILEYVPSVFPEDWKSPEGYDELNQRQQKAYMDIAKQGIKVCPGPVIQRVIELAIHYRNKYKDQGEHKGANELEMPKGELLIIKKSRVSDHNGLFKGLMKFQYGTKEESDEGFEQRKKLLKKVLLKMMNNYFIRIQCLLCQTVFL